MSENQHQNEGSEMSIEKFIAKESSGLVISVLNWIKGRFFSKTYKWFIGYSVSWRFDFQNNARKEYHPAYFFVAYDVLKLRDMISLSLDNDLHDERGRFVININLGKSWYWPCSWIWPWPWSWSRSWRMPNKWNWNWPWFWDWPWYHSRRFEGFSGKSIVTFLVYPASKIEWRGGIISHRKKNNIWFGLDKKNFKELIDHLSSGESLAVVISNPNPKNLLDDDAITIHFDLSNFRDVVQRKFSQLESIAYKKKMMRHQLKNPKQK